MPDVRIDVGFITLRRGNFTTCTLPGRYSNYSAHLYKLEKLALQ
jgi:hypothetical protein